MQVAVLLHGAALNQDGRSSSLTAPNGPAQQALIRAALQTAHMPPSKVSGTTIYGKSYPFGKLYVLLPMQKKNMCSGVKLTCFAAPF